MKKNLGFAPAAAVAIASVLLLSAASAVAGTNLGFETGDTTGWTAGGDGLYGATDSMHGFAAPAEGQYFGYVIGNSQDVYTTLSQDFTLSAGDTLTGFVGFAANDVYEDSGVIYNDSGYLSVNGTNIFYADVASTGDYLSTGWQNFSFTAPTDGTYTLQLGVANHGDNMNGSNAVLDGVAVQPLSVGVPEPSAWALMLVGFGGVGSMLRRTEARTRQSA